MAEKENDQNKTILLVGAGASVKLGVPHMKGMVEEFWKAEKNSEYRAAIKFLDRIGVERDLEEMLLVVEKIIELPDSPLNEIFIAAKDSIATIRDDMLKLRDYILEWMSERCLRFDRNSSELIWGELLQVLHDKNIPVFTTNYDFAIEWTAEEIKKINVVDNFKLRYIRRSFWDHTLQSLHKEGLKIIKLHGSINWYTTEDRADIEKIDSAAIANQEGLSIERVAIFPTRFKDIYESYFFSLYKHFLKALDESKLLIVIGHSLRDDYIRAAIRERFRDKDFQLLYVGPTEPDFTDYKLSQTKKANQIIFIEGNFEDVSTQIAYIIDTYNTDEFAKKLKSVTKFKKTPEIFFSPKVTHVQQGEKIPGEVRVNAPAIPPANLRGSLKNANDSLFEVTVTTTSSENIVVFEGIEEIKKKAMVTIPEGIEDGEYKLIFELVQYGDRVIATKEYVCNVGKRTVVSEQT